MTHLGSLGQQKPVEESVTFDWFGKTVRSSPSLGELDYIEFMSAAATLDVKHPASLGLVKDFARACVHVEDFDEFWASARANRQDAKDLFEVLTSIVEAVTDRPTERPSDSSAGPNSTATSSTGDSSSRAIARLEEQGRPDLALVVREAQVYQAG